MRWNKETLLKRAFEESEAKLADELAAFVKENDWVEDFALFTAVKRCFGIMMDFFKQPRALVQIEAGNLFELFEFF